MKMKAILIALFGLFWQIDFSQSRAVNISNTWTLPQPGFNVFYRYFRDKISWFEADAVCQFHHANLVTVENVEQFDATRGFLQQLDIVGNVWIGLMRPSNGDQFAWSNSKPLLVSEGYWAEPWALTDVPLCAVIDPAKDFRWHALRCDVENAGFICEMEVPDWAIQCSELSDVTIQYISDSGNVELTRHCRDFEKTLSCTDKMDKIAMFNELKCPDEEESSSSSMSVTTDNEEFTSSTTEEMSSSTFAPVVVPKVLTIEKMSFDDDEIMHEINDNRLDIVAKKGDDLMVGDQPVADVEVFATTSNTRDVEEDKKVLLKLTEKKEIEPKKKSNLKKSKDDDRMMGDAPSSIDEKTTTDRQRRDADETTQPIVTTEEIIVSSSTMSNDLSTIDDSSTVETSPTEIPTTTIVPTTTTEQPTTKFIVQGHPLFHSQTVFKDPIPQENHNANLERKDVGNTDERFVPPMLLVKTRFSSKYGETDEAKETTTETVTDSGFEFNITDIADDNSTDIIDFISTEISKISSSTEESIQNVTTLPADDETKPIKVEKRNDPRLGLNAVKTTSKPQTTVESLSTSQEPEDVSSSSSATEETLSSVTESQDEEHEITSLSSTEDVELETTSEQTQVTTEATAEKLIELNEPVSSLLPSSSPLLSSSTEVTKATESIVEILSTTENAEKMPMAKLIEISTSAVTTERETMSTIKPTKPTTTRFNNEINDHFDGEMENSSEGGENEEHHHVENNLNNEDFQPYKPVHHRTFTQHDRHHSAAIAIGRMLG